MVSFLEKIRTGIPRKVRQGLILFLIILGITLLLVAGGPTMPLVAWGLIACAILFLATDPKKAIYGSIVIGIFYLALSLRVYAPHDSIFGGEWVNFGGNDPWYHMRLVENLVQHFPHLIAFDPFTFFPYGQAVPFAPFFDLMLGFFIWVIALGSPTQYTIETVGAYFPAILGALVTVPVYFIGRELFNRNVGLLSAALIAILPGEFLFRSLLGFTDHHIAEVLFSATAILFLILAIKRARGRETSFSHVCSRDWGNLKKPLIYALLAGLALGIYLISWSGGLLFVLVIFAYMIVQYIIDHLRGKSTDYLCIIGVPLFLIALVVVIPFSNLLMYGGLVIASLTIGMLAFLGLSGLSRLMDYGKLWRVSYPLAALAELGLTIRYGLALLLILVGIALFFLVGGLIGQIIIPALIVSVISCLASRRGTYVPVILLVFSAGAGLFYLIDPSLYHSAVGRFSIFTPSETAQTIMEARPLFSGFDISSLTEHRVWHYFTTGFFIVPIALLLLIYAAVRGKSAEKVLLVIWSVIMLLAMLGQVRFAYYFAVNAALLMGYFCWRIPGWISRVFQEIGFREPSPDDKRSKKRRNSKREKPTGFIYLRPRYVSRALAVIIVFFLAYYPNIGEAKTTAENPWGPNEAWYSSLIWMSENTPDPFEDPGFYYELYERPPSGERFDYPESAYGVMSWWDYGHWITRIAHRIPNANPFQSGAREAARFFTAQDESSANEMLDELGSKYIIIDFEMAMTKFHAIATWAVGNTSKFYEPCYRQADGTSKCYEESVSGRQAAFILYYPEYYQSMVSRLYKFGEQEVVPVNSTWAISYVEGIDEGGNKYKVITDAANEGEAFPTYEEAKVFLDDHPDFVLVGLLPFASPVPLEKLNHYELVNESVQTITWGEEEISYVKIFEYVP